MDFLLFSRLVEFAQAIEGGNLDVADSLLAEIQSLAAKEESIWTRTVVKYCAEALVRRAYGIRPPCLSTLLPLSNPSDFVYYPFKLLPDSTTADAIADAFSSGNKGVHVIDFSIKLDPRRWIYLFQKLKRQYGGLQSVLITSITPKLSKHSDHLRQNHQFVSHAASLQDVNLELRQLICNSPDDIVNCISKLRRKREDEMMVVNWDFILHKLLAQDGAMEQVLSKVKDLGADIMVIVEQEANLNSPHLSERLEQSFQYYCTTFKALEEDCDRHVFTEMYFRRQIGNVVACEGVDRVERIESFAHWQNRLSQAGFCPVPQQVDKFDEEFVIEENEGHNILLSRHGCPLAVASVWKLTDPPQFSGGE
jgi:DELLA protein